MWLLAAFVFDYDADRAQPALGRYELAGIFRLMPRVAIVVLIAWLWVGLVVDQMPCFLGVPNCD